MRIGGDVGGGSSSSTTGGTGSITKVQYTALGNETDPFYVPIGATMLNTNYGVTNPTVNSGAVPGLKLPTAPGDRTTTTFKVAEFAPLDAGQVLTFYLFGF